ncbi:MAG: hypothetical protein ABI980_13970 [Nitrospirota bacterium]
MPCSIQPFRRFPVCWPVTYHAGVYEGQGNVWNLSVNGSWRLSDDVPLRVGQTCPLTINLPNQPRHIGRCYTVGSTHLSTGRLNPVLLDLEERGLIERGPDSMMKITASGLAHLLKYLR